MKLYKLEVWAPSSLPDGMLLTSAGLENRIDTISADDIIVRTRLMTWTVAQDPFAGLTDDSERSTLREQITRELGPSTLGSQSGPSVLLDLIEAVEASSSKWATGFASSGPFDETEPDHSVQIRGDVAFALQLRWVYDVFRDVPGVSFLIR